MLVNWTEKKAFLILESTAFGIKILMSATSVQFNNQRQPSV